MAGTKHLKSCPVYGIGQRDDEPCRCAEFNREEHIKKLELKIDLMRYFVPQVKEDEIDKKIHLNE